MKFVMASASAMALCATGAMAAGLDRSGQGVGVLFEDGDYVELSFGTVTPSVSGLFMGAMDSENVTPQYYQVGFGVRNQINDKFAMAMIIDQPFGASVDYSADAAYPLAGTNATVASMGVTALGQYQINDRVSVHGGVRYQSLTGDVTLTAPAAYTLEASGSGLGVVAGAAYEIPDIALRVALTYNSKIKNGMDAIEAGVVPSNFDIVTPQSVNLDFQTGIAADTLLFGSVRWVEWSAFDITPTLLPEPLVDYDNDTFTYSIGVGRKFSDSFSGSIAFGYEETVGDPVSNLGPTDGYMSVQLGGQYTMNNNMKISGGIRYVQIGDATTKSLGSEFADNSAIGLGMKIGYSF